MTTTRRRSAAPARRSTSGRSRARRLRWERTSSNSFSPPSRPGYQQAAARPVCKRAARLEVPPADLGDDGLLAVGRELSPERLVLAYSRGIRPWYEDGLPILWPSPDPRLVLEAEQLKVPS